jgi:hypothetical protein
MCDGLVVKRNANTWSALLFGNDKGLTGGGKADSTDNACHCQKELFSEL